MYTNIIRRLITVVTSFLAGIIFIGCTNTPQKFGMIYTVTLDGNQDIYRMTSDNLEVERLTFTPLQRKWLLHPSKDGARILFNVLGGELVGAKSGVYLLDLKNGTTTNLTTDLPIYSEPGAWSPDEKKIAFINGPEIALYIMNSDGSNKEAIPLSISETRQIGSVIDWSPDGKYLVLSAITNQSVDHALAEVYILELSTKKVAQITDDKLGLCSAGSDAWSPNSQQILIECQDSLGIDSPTSIYTARLDGRHVISLTNGYPELKSCLSPRWSPNGKQVTFVCHKGGDQDGLYIVNSDGNALREVKVGHSENLAFLRYPIWSPDGTQIIYVAGTDYQHANIYSVNIDGTNNRSLTHQVAEYEDLSVYPLP
jgi:Tol biopolymer transport system component